MGLGLGLERLAGPLLDPRRMRAIRALRGAIPGRHNPARPPSQFGATLRLTSRARLPPSSQIRLFWTDDTRFAKQFKPGQLTTFKPYSKYPPCFKDIAFWIPDGFEPNDFFELGRAVAGELVEKVDLIDEFTNPKKAKTSHCYRITYRSMDRSLTDDEVNKMQEDLRERAANELAVELR